MKVKYTTKKRYSHKKHDDTKQKFKDYWKQKDEKWDRQKNKAW